MKTAHTRDMNKKITIMQSLRDDKYTPTFPVPVVSMGISQIRSDNYYANALRTRL